MSESWNYLQNGAAQGPVSGEALRSMLAAGQLSLDDLVWRPGLTEWTQAERFPELRPAPAPAPASPVPAIQLAAPPAFVLPAQPEPAAAHAQAAPGDLDAAIGALRATKPWARFLAVLGFIGTGLMALIGLGFLLLASFLPDAMVGSLPKPMRFLLPLVYLVIALLQFPPVVFLNRFASRIGALARSRDPRDLAPALEAQKSFWRYVGIFTLVVIIVYVLAILGIVATAVVSGVPRRL